MNKIHVWVNTGLIVLIGLMVLVGGNQSAQSEKKVAGTTNYDALSLSGALTALGDTTISGGTLNVTTANTATSTVIAGCYEFYASSTATAQKFQASTTPGAMYSQYGSCPRL